jgi:uncharacterized protein
VAFSSHHRRASFCLAPVAALALITSACSWFTTRPAPQINRQRINLEMRRAVELAGGSDIWIKKTPARKSRFVLPARDEPAEIVTTPASFDRVAAALQAVASRESLDAAPARRGSRRGERELKLRFTYNKQFVSEWDLREIPQLRRAAIIIDDMGQDLHAAQKLLDLPFPLTFSVLPHLANSARTAEEAHRQGREVMLHLPMEPEPGAPALPGPGEIKVGMTSGEVAGIVEGDLSSVPFARGVNNHMGSRATADARLMTEVMRVLAARRLFFVDSRTTKETTALDTARRLGIPAFYRSVFLDDTETVPYSLGQLRQFRRIIEEKGAAIAIGHPHPSTIAALQEFLPELENDDIQLVPASELVSLPEVARISPPAARKIP